MQRDSEEEIRLINQQLLGEPVLGLAWDRALCAIFWCLQNMGDWEGIRVTR
jgi:hypothetical protein